MKTDELIALLAHDATPVKRCMLPARLLLFSLIGAFIAAVILVPWLGIRPDLADAMGGTTFWMKAIYTFGLGVGGFALVERLSRPGVKGGFGWLLAAACVAAIVAIAVSELMSMPPEDMPDAIMGSSWYSCPLCIIVLSIPGLAAILWTMRRFAPTRPTLAGAAAGLLAGGLAATVYGLHCDETAAPFVAIWYSLGVVVSALLGAMVGPRALRW
jgi:hypothetical protein